MSQRINLIISSLISAVLLPIAMLAPFELLMITSTAADPLAILQPAAEKVAAPPHFNLLADFETNSDKLTAQSEENVKMFSLALKDERLKGKLFKLRVHVRPSGDAEFDQKLSERRAVAVKGLLESCGVATGVISTVALGSSEIEDGAGGDWVDTAVIQSE